MIWILSLVAILQFNEMREFDSPFLKSDLVVFILQYSNTTLHHTVPPMAILDEEAKHVVDRNRHDS